MSATYIRTFNFDLTSDNVQQKNDSADLTKCLFTQRARYAPAQGDRGWSFVNRWEVCYGSIYYIPRHKDDPKVFVGAGVRAWLGAYSSVKTLQDAKPALAFGLVNRLFYELDMDIITFYCEVLEEMGFHRRENVNRREYLKDFGMNKSQRTRMTERLKGIRLKTNKFLIEDREYRFGERHMTFERVADGPARTYRYRCGKTMEEIYYRLGSELEYPWLPLCKVKIGRNSFLLPMEGSRKRPHPAQVLKIHEKPQRFTGLMNNVMRMKFIKGVCRDPSVHKKFTEDLFNMMEFDNSNMSFLSDFMFSIIPRMITCNGLVLDTPNVIDKVQNVLFDPLVMDRNSIPMTERRAIKRKELNDEGKKVDYYSSWNFFIITEPPAGELHCAVVIMARSPRRDSPGREGDESVCDSQAVQAFFINLMEKCRERGLSVAEQPLLRVYEKIPPSKLDQTVQDAKRRFLDLQETSKEGSPQKIMLLLVIHDRTDLIDDCQSAYGLIKSVCDNKYGVASQVVDASTVKKATGSGDKTIYYNIALKINAKLGGVNQAVVFDSESRTAEFSPKDAVMYVGIDVTHPTANSGIDISIACMVANFDLAATRYTNEIFAQMKPKETVECFEQQFNRLMTKFHEHSHVWPRHIVVLRDGVSDSQMLSTAFLEMKWIRDAWKRLTADDAELEPTYTYIVIQKRHLTRFYQPSKDEQGKETYVNISSGTVVDNVVVSPKLFDFYLASQFGAIGTTRPAHYTVVLDEWMLSADQIYEMCYKLCFLYARCRIPVSLPCPVYYAHIVCEKAKEVYKTLCSNHEFDGIEDVDLRKNRIEDSLTAHKDYPGMHFV
ncbi:piwi domain protein [Ancylostoma caninum]|uniref:Piwi domain protein n=1 Tax=Ancylostoma caninum TaxID=29170 RepID=A0A368H3F8_ANCCA|nr:piwi domain protein [Ancylostoma caninum]